ncbi:MAG: GNAT family N-acetyltransferase [Candidatus Bathyarchaeia archaeon]|nr:GNAT family N-acetyltransferase [Candidatus Bathyarchaeota archaeon]
MNKENTSSIIIREATPNDLLNIVKLAKELTISESNIDPMVNPFSKFQDSEWILRNIKGDKTVVFVAEHNGEIVGYILGWVSQPWDYKSNRGYICDCFVKEKYRRKGIGAALCKAILNWFINRNVTCIEADVYSNNTASLEMFKSLGFKEVAKKLRLVIDEK